MEEQLLKEIAQDIGETKGMVSGMKDDFEKIDKRFDKVDTKLNRHDKRIRRLETWFVPLIAGLSLFIQEIRKVFGHD